LKFPTQTDRVASSEDFVSTCQLT